MVGHVGTRQSIRDAVVIEKLRQRILLFGQLVALDGIRIRPPERGDVRANLLRPAGCLRRIGADDLEGHRVAVRADQARIGQEARIMRVARRIDAVAPGAGALAVRPRDVRIAVEYRHDGDTVAGAGPPGDPSAD